MDLFAEDLTNDILEQMFVLNEPSQTEAYKENHFEGSHNQVSKIKDVEDLCIQPTKETIQEGLNEKENDDETDLNDDFCFEECTNCKIKDSNNDFYFEVCNDRLENSSDVEDSFSCASLDKNSFSESNLFSEQNLLPEQNSSPKHFESFQEVQVFENKDQGNECSYNELYFEFFESMRHDLKTDEENDEIREVMKDLTENDFDRIISENELKINGFHSDSDSNKKAFEVLETQKAESYDLDSEGCSASIDCFPENGNSELIRKLV
jgi:hypothetical protein